MIAKLSLLRHRAHGKQGTEISRFLSFTLTADEAGSGS